VSDWVWVGSIVGVHGIRGELKVQADSDFPERFTRKGKLRRVVSPQGVEQMIKLVGGRRHQNNYLIRLEGVLDRNQAELLIGSEIFVPVSERPDLAPGEFMVSDLVGLEVRRLDTGEAIGRVRDITNTGLQDLLMVQTASGEVLIPFVEALVPEVHSDWLGVVALAGLLEPDTLS